VNRLFEALSNLEMEQSAPPADRPAAGSLLVIPSEVTAAKDVAPDTDQELKVEPSHLKVARLTAAIPQATPQDVTVKEHVSHASVEGARTLTEPRPNTPPAVEEPSVLIKGSPESRLVAFTNPNCLGAEKFRALVARLDDMRKQGALKSFQVTSSIMNEGKTLVAGNVAVTLAKYSGTKTLLIEGDMHRPALAALLGLEELRGVGDWWSGQDAKLGNYIHRLNHLPLWFLPAGQFRDRPSDIISSVRFARAFAQLAKQFEWIVVDSTPMQPIVDVNLWSKLVDGTLLVVREGITPVHALKKGLQALIRPRLIGVVMNDAAGPDQKRYSEQYSAVRKPAAGRFT
jgi:capsular exopolysaccharide synthesis family protein